LRALIAVDDGVALRPSLLDGHAQRFGTSAVLGLESIDQPTTLRDQASRTTAQYTLPSRVGCSVMSVTHS
jgi:hypothetical protein